MRFGRGCVLVAALLSLTACSNPALTGVAVGSAATATCGAFYRGPNRALVCGGIGVGTGFVAAGIQQYLNEKERQQLASATVKTLNTRTPQTVKSDRGVTITTEIVRPEEQQAPQRAASPPPRARPAQRPQSPASAPQVAAAPAAAGEQCELVRQTVVTTDGQRHQDTVRACQRGGDWVV